MPYMRDCKNEKCGYHDESYSGCSCERIEIGNDGECLQAYYLQNISQVDEEEGNE